MSVLKTYEHDPNDPFSSGVAAAARVANQPLPWLEPGTFVTVPGRGGFGIVVAVTPTEVAVLWSVEPEPRLFANPFGVAHRVNMQSIAQQLIQVQPMTAPSGLIFYLDYQYGNWKLDPRCTEGPWWRKVFWRAWLCTSGKTQSWWRSFSSWVRSWSSRKSTNTVSAKPDEFAENLVKKWAKGCHLTRGGLPPSGRTGAPFEGPQAAPENASGDGT